MGQGTLANLRAAVISDVHSNLPALEAVLGAIDAAGFDEVWCLGDVVGYGAEPDACADLVRESCDLCLAGNHDLAVLGGLDVSAFSDTAAEAVRWTRENAAERTLEFLRELEPAGLREGLGLFHASPRDPVWEYVLSEHVALLCLLVTEAQLVLVGHSHVALGVSWSGTKLAGGVAPAGTKLDLRSARHLANPGSVGQPRDGDPRAAWLLVDTDAFRGTFRRVAYDVERTQSEIREHRLPDILAARLAHGI